MSLLLNEIVEGYSAILYGKDEVVYFRHPTLKESLIEEKSYKKFEERGKRAGLKSEQELLDIAIKYGKWSKDKEDETADLIWSNNRLRKTLESMVDPSQKRTLEEKIEKAQSRIEELKKERDLLVGASLEKFILVRSTLLFCKNRLFFDEDLTKAIDDKGIEKSIDAYNLKMGELLNRENLLRAVFSPQFFDLFLIYENAPEMILGKNGVDLTLFQKDLIVYGTILYKRMTNSNIPENVKNNPISLFKYKDNGGKNKEEKESDPRGTAEKAGGVDKIKPEHKLT